MRFKSITPPLGRVLQIPFALAMFFVTLMFMFTFVSSRVLPQPSISAPGVSVQADFQYLYLYWPMNLTMSVTIDRDNTSSPMTSFEEDTNETLALSLDLGASAAYPTVKAVGSFAMELPNMNFIGEEGHIVRCFSSYLLGMHAKLGFIPGTEGAQGIIGTFSSFLPPSQSTSFPITCHFTSRDYIKDFPSLTRFTYGSRRAETVREFTIGVPPWLGQTFDSLISTTTNSPSGYEGQISFRVTTLSLPLVPNAGVKWHLRLENIDSYLLSNIPCKMEYYGDFAIPTVGYFKFVDQGVTTTCQTDSFSHSYSLENMFNVAKTGSIQECKSKGGIAHVDIALDYVLGPAVPVKSLITFTCPGLVVRKVRDQVPEEEWWVRLGFGRVLPHDIKLTYYSVPVISTV